MYCRKDSQDQLVPDLNERKFWRDKYLNHLNYYIDNFHAAGFRVDLPHELHTPDNDLDYTLIHEVFIEAIKYTWKHHQRNSIFSLKHMG